MPFLQCLWPGPNGGICGKLSKQTRCPEHRKAKRKLYGADLHEKPRKVALTVRPVCNNCGHRATVTGKCIDPACDRCPLQFDHVEPIRGGRSQGDPRRQLLCRKCNRAKGDR